MLTALLQNCGSITGSKVGFSVAQNVAGTSVT